MNEAIVVSVGVLAPPLGLVADLAAGENTRGKKEY
jgi:hypothetical protein